MKIRFPRSLRLFKNFYILVGLCFLGWIIFFDTNDLVSQFSLHRQQKELINEKEFYLEKMNEVKEERKALLNNSDLLEKFAREKYLMKKPSEDIYVITKDN